MWDQHYSVEEYIYGTSPNQFLAQHAGRFARGGRILCLADGEGRNGVFLAEQGYHVAAVDSSSVARDKALRLAEAHGVSVNYEYSVADLKDYAMGENKWDAIVSIFCHLPVSLRHQVHQNICRALKPDGVLLLEAYTPRQLGFGTGGPPVEEMMMSSSTLTTELSSLSFELLQEIDRDVIEGVYHTGRGAVVQLIARK